MATTKKPIKKAAKKAAPVKKTTPASKTANKNNKSGKWAALVFIKK